MSKGFTEGRNTLHAAKPLKKNLFVNTRSTLATVSNKALEGLKSLSAEDQSLYLSAMEDGQQTGFGYSFAGLLAYARPGNSDLLLEEDSGSVCIYRLNNTDEGQRLDLLLAPAPMNPAVLNRALERANEFNSNKKARILKIDEKDKGAVADVSGLRVRERKIQYVYATANFANLSGNRFRNVRRYVSKVEAIPGLSVSPYKKELKAACLGLLSAWRKHHTEKHGTRGGVGKTRRLLALADYLDSPGLFGEVIFLDQKLVGFALGGDIRPGLTAFLEAKSAPDIPGLSYFQRYSFMSKLDLGTLINDGPDVGRAGLAQLKNSLRPVFMHTEFQASQKH